MQGEATEHSTRIDRVSSHESMASSHSDEPSNAPAPEEVTLTAAEIAEAENLQQLKDTNTAIEAAALEHATSALAEASGVYMYVHTYILRCAYVYM